MSRTKKGTYNICTVCNEEFYCKPSEHDRNVCSKRCLGISQRVSKVEKTCKGCGNSFETYPSESYLEHCSRKCYTSSRLAASIGTRKTTPDGYVLVRQPDNPMAQPSSGFVFEHRLVMADTIGRTLLPHEKPHHVNGIRNDNDPTNLELWSTSQPAGQRVEDKISWALEFLSQYGNVIYEQSLAVQNPAAVVVGEFGTAT